MEISIKKEELQKKSIFVATPMYGGMNHGLYAKACLDLQSICIQYGVQVKFSFLGGVLTRFGGLHWLLHGLHWFFAVHGISP